MDTIRPRIKNENPQSSPYRDLTLQRSNDSCIASNASRTSFLGDDPLIVGSSTTLDTIGPPVDQENPQLLPYPSSITLHSNGSRCNASFLTSPSYISSIAVQNHIAEVCLSGPPRISLSLHNKVEVGPSSFQKIKLLGRGAVGKVFLVREKKTGKLYAMKGTYHLLKRAILIHKVDDSFIQEGDDSKEKDQTRVDRTGDSSNCQSPIHSDPSPFISVGGLSILLHGLLHGG